MHYTRVLSYRFPALAIHTTIIHDPPTFAQKTNSKSKAWFQLQPTGYSKVYNKILSTQDAH